ncbi:putative N-acetylglucosamine kinase [Rhizobium leguminosarum bv. trifolii WSM2297]|uniref:Putative N-acetylglucosamine kinase n=1 Tax=Rhizobium leguminosarum bv. trifolii WSM2297 TaxID=754762 RepID=J0WBX4_RHILT|nr:BadF/BadG/BcrA/BcrD ATPase family protein [Rhizobium leguminosarum]EJC83271.1 putative N-acetylglucosamine kinase [Rhizobium leguminosarum bv. trifolii WSM2297]EJC85136.1 putative N-acetylglucosamine kinase [Rhizobium leguminosarum bv. trifolii WSM2297]
MSSELILGIDGGGSKVLVALADRNGRILQTSRGGGVNPMDNPNWLQELEQHLAPFRDEARLAAVAAALPAYGEVARLSELQGEAIKRTFPNLPRQILNDVDAAHLGAFAGQPGILILSGTGSMSWARNSQGASARAGGWGDILGDEGSSHWIGRKALNLVTQSLDGRTPPTALAQALFAHLDVDAADPMNALGGWISSLTNPRAQIAALSTLVDQIARGGDDGAIGLIDQAAGELARHHEAVAGYCDPDAEWSYAGGTFSSQILLGKLEQRIGRPPASPRLPPIGGALLVAAQLLDWPLDEGWFGQIAATAKGGDCASK